MGKKSFKIKGNLAEALDDTVSSAKNNAGELHVEIIPLRKVQLDEENPRDLLLTVEDLHNGINESDVSLERKNTEKQMLSSLAKSIKEQGIINPITVYKQGDHYKLIAGERRTLASILATKSDIPARILTSRPDMLKLSLLQWIENIEREDLTLWERVRNLEKILDAYATTQQKEIDKITPTEISQLLGCSLQHGVNYRHTLNASEHLRKHIQSGEIKSIDKAAFISKSKLSSQKQLIEACLNGATLSELKKLARDTPITVEKNEAISPQSKINFGHTVNSKVAKTIINAVLEHKDYKHLESKFSAISWNNHKSIATAFRQLVKLLEQA